MSFIKLQLVNINKYLKELLKNAGASFLEDKIVLFKAPFAGNSGSIAKNGNEKQGYLHFKKCFTCFSEAP